MTKAERSRNMRYKKPALAEMGYHLMLDKLLEIIDICSEVRCFMDDETLLDALDGDEEDEYEFKMAFSALEAESKQLYDVICDNYGMEDYFDDCTVALIGNRFNLVGFDDYEEDYYSLTSYDQELAYSKSGKKIMRMTKPEMLSTIGQCIGILLSFQNVQVKFDYLKATFDILRDENNSVLKVIKEIENAYEKLEENGFYEFDDSMKKFDNLVSILPEKCWIE